MKYVIYKSNGYKVTSLENYNAMITNKNDVINCSKFTSTQSIIDYFVKFCNVKKNDFIIKD